MSYERLATRLYNTPLLITPEKADVIEGVFRAYQEGRASELPAAEPPQRIELATALSLRKADGGYFVSSSGVAVIQIHGSLVQRGDSMDALSGMTGYNRVASQLQAAIRDPGVRGVVLEIDSPGGEVPGLLEVAAMVADADKPVRAHANELAASAAYWLGSSAGKLFAPSTGMLGSIGVVMLHVDRSRQIDRAGLVYTPIFAGARKMEGSSLAPLSEGARSAAQARVDQVYAMFVEHVARARGISEDAVRATEAGVFPIQEATALGLADGVATLGDVIQGMTDDLNTGRIKPKPYQLRADAGTQTQEVFAMDPKDAPKPAANPTATNDQLAAARAEGVTEGRATAQAEVDGARREGQSAGAAAARERIKAIQTCEPAKTRPALAEHLAFETSMTVDEAQAVLAKAAPETKTGNPLDAAMRGTNPQVGADAEPSDPNAAPRINTAAIYEARRNSKLRSVK